MSDRFHKSDLSDCDRCREITLKRERMRKRQLGIGRLRSNVVLYEEESFMSHEIEQMTKQDLKRGSEMVFVVKTGLKVSEARRLATELCRVAKAQGELTV